ncbi:hypothetical protein BDR07DRAFT_1484913 [Suillus spraguei]|nr:hypothetical protein BDR07DRAFT_1484913 [Suillus spraguei]
MLKQMVNLTTEPSTTTLLTSFASVRIEIGWRDFSNGGTGHYSRAPINSLAKMQAQMATHVSAAKGPAAPGPPPPTNPTPPQSSVSPEPELPPPPTVKSPVTPNPEPLSPLIATLRLFQMGPIPPKSPTPSELMPDEVLSDHNNKLVDSEDISTTIKERKKKAPKAKQATGRTAKCHVIEEPNDDSEAEELPVAKPTKSRSKCVAHRK